MPNNIFSQILRPRNLLVIAAVVLVAPASLLIRAATPNALPGDINGDNTVNVTDLSILLSNYGKAASASTNPAADINANGDVNITDLSVLLSNFGKTSAATDLINETFASGANFAPVGGTWGVSGGAYRLTGPVSQDNPVHGLYNLSVHNTSVTGNFVVKANVSAVASDAQWDDVAVVFNYQDANNYYYASFSETNNQYIHGIFKIQNGTKTELKDSSAAFSAGATYAVRIERVGTSIQVYRNNQLEAAVNDTSFTGGKVGVGGWDNQAVFDDFIVTQLSPGVSPSPVPTTSPSPPPRTGTVYWQTNFSRFALGQLPPYTPDLSDTSWNIYGGATLKIINDPQKGKVLSVHGAANQARPDDNSQRGEQVPPISLTEGQTRYIGFNLWANPEIPQSPSGHLTLFQIKTGGAADQYPVFGMDFGHGCNCLSMGGVAPGYSLFNGGPIPRGVWTRVVLGIHVSKSPSQAWIELWRDGRLVVPRSNGYNARNLDGNIGGTMFANGSSNYIKFGIYRGPEPFVEEHRFGDMVIGDSYDAVK